MNAPCLEQSTYDRTACAPGILHLGFGAFHRTHQAFYIDKYMQKSGDLRWGIVAVNLRADTAERFAADQYTEHYVLKTISTEGNVEYHALRPHLDFFDWSADEKRAEQLLAEPDVHLVTITITESGYYLDDEGNLNLSDPLIATELSGGKPRSVYAYLRAGLRRRMESGAGPASILCCDNIRANGRMLHANLNTYLRACGDGELHDWLSDNARFPCSMVDRITPKPLPEFTQETQKLFDGESEDGVNGPTVLSEDFIQWVIEDNFDAPRPQWEEVGVTVTACITPFEEAKIRILNGGHLSIAYLGALVGYKMFDQVINDPELFAHFMAFETGEVLPELTIAPPFDKREYLDKIAVRFGNRFIGDSLERICMEGLTKHSIYLQPTLVDCFNAGREPRFGIRSAASWYVFARRVADGTLGFNYIEPRMLELKPLLADDAFDAFANSAVIWGDLPRQHRAFVQLLHTEVTEVEAQWPV